MIDWLDSMFAPFYTLPVEVRALILVSLGGSYALIYLVFYAFGAGFKCSFVLLKRLIAKIRKRG